jgi:acetyl-CoA decarbonylase/synthase complex subunit gamma
MPLTGIEIFKMLPKTNCGECGVPTCLAFAMSLAAGKAELASCPYVSDETKSNLEEASAPPIRPVSIGSGEEAIRVGGETVMFRHEKRFENPTGFAVFISDMMLDDEVIDRLERFKKLQYDRVGLTLRPELVAIKCESGDASKYQALLSNIKKNSSAAIILMSENVEILASGLEVCAELKPLLYAATKDNIDKITNLAKDKACPVAVKAENLDELIELTTKLEQSGVKDIVIDSGARKLKQAFEEQVIIRRAALEKKFRPLGYPTIILANEMTDNPMKEALIAATFVAKYGGIIVLSDFQGESLFPLLVLRMNLFTDPQRPLATTEGVYKIGNPDDNSPVLLTSNFSLTYFIVSGEMENSRMPSYLLVKDTEGLSVMTAWAAGKFGADTIATFIKKSGIKDEVKHRKLIIPGYIAIESGGLEEELPDWEILIGPREGAHIPAYLKTWKA